MTKTIKFKQKDIYARNDDDNLYIVFRTTIVTITLVISFLV